MDKQTKRLIKTLEAQGAIIRITSKGHVQVRTADHLVVAIFSGTPSDHHAWKNRIADLRRAGFRV